MTKEIPLTQGQVALVDDKDFERVNQFKWHAQCGISGRFVATRAVQADCHVTLIYMHRFILDAPPDKDVDHKNHNQLDNRRCNLRLCSPSQNGANRGKSRKNPSSKYKGVCLYHPPARWYAVITVRGKRKHLGRFKTEKEAALAYNRAAKEYYGEFASLNEIPD